MSQSIGTLWTTPVQHKGNIIKAVLAYTNQKVDLPDDYVHYQTNLTEAFTKKFPNGKIPAFEGKDGFKVFESVAVARYIASLAPNSGLLGSTPQDAALIDQWTHFVETEVDSMTDLVRLLVSGKVPYLKPLHTDVLERQLRALNTLNTYLSSHTFFVGERITLADIWTAGLIQRAAQSTVDKELRAKLPHLIRHLETVVNQPSVNGAFGPLNYVEKGITYVAPKKEEKPKAVPAPAAPKEKKEKPKKEVEDDDDEPDVPAEPKVKNPLDDLPKSSFNLEEWKREYSNKDTRGAGGSLEWFYHNFDKEGFSIYRVDFKYNSELTQVFMSSNQIGGFFNRLEASRKYLFGSVGVLGENNNSVITGVLILRGQDVNTVVNVAPDYESYEYRKLDVFGTDADKTFFEAALAWDLEEGGKKWKDGKNFK